MKIKILLMSLFFSLNLNAEYSTALDIAREKHISSYINKEEALIQRIENYILLTSRFDVKRSDMQQLYGLPSIYFNNYNKESCDSDGALCIGNTGSGININVDIDRQLIILSNSISVDANEKIKEHYERNRGELMVTENFNLMKPFSIQLSNLAKIYNKIKLDPINEISNEQPTNINKVWYKPNGNGGYDIYKHDTTTNEWFSLGTSNNNGINSIYVETFLELEKIPCASGYLGYVGDNNLVDSYVCNTKGKWVIQNSSNLSLKSRISEIANRTEDPEGTIVTTNSVNGEFNGEKQFTKMGNIWFDETKKYFIAQNISELNSAVTPLHATGYTFKNKNETYILKKMIVGNIEKWVYQSNSFKDTVNNFSNLNENDIVFDNVNNIFFIKQIKNQWKNLESNIFLSENRTYFTNVVPNAKYLTVNNDCNEMNCNGNYTNSFYSGNIKDEMYEFYHSNTTKNLNNLTDAITRNSIIDVYTNEDNFAIVGTNIYAKMHDTRNRICYKNINNGLFYTKRENTIPSILIKNDQPNLPPEKNCSNIVFDNSSIVLDERIEATDWNDAPHNASIIINGKKYIHYSLSGKDFWTDNIYSDGQIYATEVFTKDSRTKLPYITNDNIIALTRKTGTEYKYTDNGITSKIDKNFKQWYFSTFNGNTNNLVDAIGTGQMYSNANALSVGYATHNGRVYERCGDHWCIYKSYQVVDINHNLARKENIVGITEKYNRNDCFSLSTNYGAGRFKTKSDCDIAGNGLFYDITEDSCKGSTLNDWYTLDEAKLICENKGMRLPTIQETQAAFNGSNKLHGVPSCGRYFTWTSTNYSPLSNAYYVWFSADYSILNKNDNKRMVRCVKNPKYQ